MTDPAQLAQFDRYERVARATGVADYSTRLIHYTSLAKLQAMLTSNELWFGKLTDMNDTAEGDHFLDAVLSNAPRLILGKDIPGIEQQVGALRAAVREQTYVSSWCEYFDTQPEGRLMMWRAYGDSARGVGLVVDSSQFQNSAMTARKIGFHVNTVKVDYVKQGDAIDYANHFLSRLADVNFIRPVLEEKLMMAMMLAIKAPCVKHHSFSEEAEIRLISLPGLLRLLGHSCPPEQMRELDGRSFFSLALQEYPDFDLDLRTSNVLKTVLVGPAGDKMERSKTVRALLDAHGLQHVSVEISDIPFADQSR